MSEKMILQVLPSGDLLYKTRLKGSNPEREKHPTVKCPNCGKFLYYLYDTEAKNRTVAFDADNSKYADYPKDSIWICKKCHHRIGTLTLTKEIRKLLNLPSIQEWRKAAENMNSDKTE